MAGLLDAFNSPEFQRGMFMLAAARPQSEQSRAGLLSYMDNQEQAKLKRGLLEMQIEDKKLENQATQAKLAQQAQMQGLLGQVFGGGPSAADSARLDMEASPDFAGPVSPQAIATANAPKGGFANVPLDTIAQLKAMGGPDLLTAWQAAQQGTKFDPGAMYRMPDGSVVMAPKLGEGQVYDGQRVRAVPGAAQANADYIGAQTAAQEWAKVNPQSMLKQREAQIAAQHDLVNGFDAEGNPVTTNRASVLAGQTPFRPGLTAAQQASQAGQVAGATDEAKANVARETKRQDAVNRSNQLITVMDEAIDILKQGPTASLAGAGVDTVTNALGINTKGAEMAQKLEAISGWAVANVPRMEGPQSDKDVTNYQTMAGRVGDRTLPIQQRIAAAEQVKSLQQKYSHLNGGEASQSQPQQKQSNARVFDTLPTTGFKPGARMRDTATGQILTFDGMKWK